MNIQISAAWEKVQGMLNGFIALVPNLVLALVVKGLLKIFKLARQ